MKKLLLGLLFSVLVALQSYATDYYTKSTSATLVGNSGLSANWTTNVDGLTGLGSVVILPSDNLFVLNGAVVAMSTATSVNNLDIQGGVGTTLVLGNTAMALTVAGNLTGTCKRTGTRGYFLMTGINKDLAYVDAAGSNLLATAWDPTVSSNSGIRITGTIKLTGPTVLLSALDLNGAGALALNGQTLNVGAINSGTANKLVGGPNSELSIFTQGTSNSSNVYFDETNPGSTNFLERLTYGSPGNVSAFVNLRSSMVVNNLTAAKNSSTGFLKFDAPNISLTVVGTYSCFAATGANTVASGSKFIFETGSSLAFVNETAKPIQNGSNVTINGGTLKFDGFAGTPVVGNNYTLLIGGIITGAFTNIVLPNRYQGTVTVVNNTVKAQITGLPPIYRSENFDDTAVQSIWSTTPGSNISLSTDHMKTGTKSLKWDAASSGKLIASELNIPSGETKDFYKSGLRFYLYNKTVSNDTLIVRLYDNTGALKRVGKMLLNFTGWRDYYRSTKFDYGFTGNSNQNGLPEFAFDKFELEYRPQLAGNEAAFYIDQINFIGVEGRRMPGTHVLEPDLSNIAKAFDTSTMLLDAWKLYSNLPAPTPTNQEMADWTTVKNKFGNEERSNLDISIAKQYVINLGISRNPDGTPSATKGFLIPLLASERAAYERQLDTLSRVAGTLARHFKVNPGDSQAKALCQQLVEYILDQGVAEGGDINIANSAGASARIFYTGFIDALPLLDTQLQGQTMRMLKWAYQYGLLFEDPAAYTPGYDVDFIQNKSSGLFEMAFVNPNLPESIRDLKLIRDFLQRFTVPSGGTRDGFKVDGLAFHHNSLYPGYMYTLNIWINQADRLKGTAYRINKVSYDRMCHIVKSLTMPVAPVIPVMSEKIPYANTLSARHPFATGLYVKSWDIKKLIGVGADITGQSIEPEMAAVYNYFFAAENAYPAVQAADLNQFYQYNYGQLGVRRSKKWVATMRGFTDKLWGTETYAEDNRYGRYQSYGALEFLYGSTLKASGYVDNNNGRGWDWNVMPGTTSLPMRWLNLKTKGNYVDEFQKRSFAGALAAGKDGIWAMDFEQRPDRDSYERGDLRFKKSVFAFDSIFIALGTGINTTVADSSTRTNLFQNAYLPSEIQPEVYLNNITGYAPDINQDIPANGEAIWLVNTVGTGYFVPQNNGTVHVFRGEQTSPPETGKNEIYAAKATKAWIDHGVAPVNQRYEFVAVPGVTPAQMQLLSGQFTSGSIYQIQKQSDTLHAVKYIPENTTGYAFFHAAANVGLGLVKSLSGHGLVMVKEVANTVSVSFANPDLNTIDTTDHKFRTRPYTATLVISGKWNKVSSAGGHTETVVNVQGDSTAITFTVKDGLKVDILLQKIIPAALLVQMQDGDGGQTGNNHIKPNLKLINEGIEPIPYNELTVRYWITAENFAGINTWIDYAEMGNGKVKMQYVPLTQPRVNAFGYIEYSFEASAGTLAAGGNSGQIQSRFANSDWSNLTEADDYSYKALASFAANDRVTAYRNGELVWGTEPDLATPQLKLRVYSENKNSNTNGNTISTYLNLVNEGNMPVSYEDLSIRYWFTADGSQNLNHWIDYAKLGSGNIQGKFVGNLGLNKADTYFQISVKPMLGSLYPSSSTGNIQYRVAKTDWSNFNETNDHSYKVAARSDTNNRVTIYYKDQLVYGIEPLSVPGARLGVSVEAGTSLEATLLGNPVQASQADILVRGVQGDLLRMVLYSAKGEQISDKQVIQKQSIEQHSFILNRGVGLYLLKISNKTETIVLKVINP